MQWRNPWSLALALAAFLALGPTPCPPAFAQSTQGSAAPSGPAKARARQHFERARQLYKQGAYREALVELDAAHTLDPVARELVFNLAVIHEKLGNIDEALRYLHLYLGMGLSAPEATKADAYIHRLEGARRELAAPQATPKPPDSAAATDPAKPPEPTDGSSRPPDTGAPAELEGEVEAPSPGHGRVDAATVVALGVTLAAAGAGTVFGVKAISDRPTGFQTGVMGSFDDFKNRNDQAHREAVVADVCFGVSLAAAVLTAYLYFGRTKAPEVAGHPRVTGGVLPGGGAVVLEGRF
jgi:tetratricopeptide (TPR) repeat protein